MTGRDLRGLLPREHGSWAYLLIPQVAALLATNLAAPVLLWLLGSLFSFAALQGFAAARRRRARWSPSGTVCAFVGATVLASTARRNPAALILIVPSAIPAALALFSTRGRIGRDDAIEVLGIVSASILGGGGLWLAGASAKLICLLTMSSCAYALLSLIWIRVRLATELQGRHPILPHGWNIPASLVILTLSAVGGAALGGFIVGLLPGIYLGRCLLKLPRRTDGLVRLNMLGVQEGIAAAVFAAGLGLFLPI
jgi:hypothetical protein